ncbi:MAG: fatty acid hydroxylase [Flavobacteriaceae bacterium]|nr:fatty acid hydroxylase [Flavobacteriaceae bacterium]|tara:strand:+ start:2847 stop:3728 length:882 start_codon:yes stop_codon:yes gene_type:complete
MEAENISKLIPVLVLLILGIIESLGGLYFDDKRSKNDLTIELVSLTILPTLIQPAILALVLFVMNLWFPVYEDYFINSYVLWHILAFLVFDDLTQYFWHRFSHENAFMWKLHRPHHVVEEMGVLVTYRNAFLYYAFMPGIWLSAILIFLGMTEVYLYYLPIKMIVIMSAHSETKWDRILYKYKFLHPFAWVIERTISTPSTHYAHHGLTSKDEISNPNGNYGNLLFFWDVLFGTAKITRKYPSKFGAWNKMKEPWYVQLLFPIIKSKDSRSELSSIKTNMDYDPSKDYKDFVS